MFSNDELAAARKLTEPLLDVWSYRRDAVALAAAVLRSAERGKAVRESLDYIKQVEYADRYARVRR